MGTRRFWNRPPRQADSPQPRRIGVVVVAVTVVVVAVGTIGVAALGLGGRHRTAATTKVHLTSTTVTRCTLTSTDTASARLSYGSATPLPIQTSGLITWLPRPGSVVHEGQQLVRVGDRPVTLLYGSLPQYRALQPAAASSAGKTTATTTTPAPMRGSDVRELKSALRRLGYGRFSDNDGYGNDIVSAVKAWQRHLGEPATGVVALGDVFYASGPIRVLPAAGVIVGVQMSPSALTRTGDDQVVTATLPGPASWARVGAKATVVTDHGASIGAVVASSRPTGDSTSSGGTEVAVVLHVKNQSALDGAGLAVTLKHVNAQRVNVLCVPAAALVALAEGGYGLQRGEAEDPSYVAVQTGLFAGGRVEVSGAGVVAGLRVEMPEGD
jgi:peptidoglycan hydrolase-like protein with peptidoglycan-binding domain